MAHASEEAIDQTLFFTKYRILYYISLYSVFQGVEITFIATFFCFEIFHHCFLTYRYTTIAISISGSKRLTKNSVRLICANGSNFLVMLDIAHVFTSEFGLYGNMFSNVPISFRCHTFKCYGNGGVVQIYGPVHNLLFKFKISQMKTKIWTKLNIDRELKGKQTFRFLNCFCTIKQMTSTKKKHFMFRSQIDINCISFFAWIRK